MSLSGRRALKNLIFCTLVLSCLLLQFTVKQASAAGTYDWMKSPSQDAGGVDGGGIGAYLTIKAGAFFPDDINGTKMNTGTGVDLGAGISPMRFFAVEATAGYLEADDYDDNLNNYHRELTAIPVMLTVKAIAPLQIIDLYALAGAGFHYAMFKVINRSDPASPTLKNDDVLTAYHYGGGLRLRAFLGALNIEARMLEVSKDFGRVREYSGYQLYGSLDFPF
jgi:hypothetical protein